MIILGVTGSVGMGKSAVAAMLGRMGVAVHDADAAVHRLFRPGGAAVAAVSRAFPGVGAPDGGIDRRALGATVFGDDGALKRLEVIVHPMVRSQEKRFLEACRRRRLRLVALDIPLLFETGGEKRCDAVLVVSAPAFLQTRRVLTRPGMTPGRLAAIRAKQTPDAEKRRRADFVVSTAGGKGTALRALRRIVHGLLNGRSLRAHT